MPQPKQRKCQGLQANLVPGNIGEGCEDGLSSDGGLAPLRRQSPGSPACIQGGSTSRPKARSPRRSPASTQPLSPRCVLLATSRQRGAAAGPAPQTYRLAPTPVAAGRGSPAMGRGSPSGRVTWPRRLCGHDPASPARDRVRGHAPRHPPLWPAARACRASYLLDMQLWMHLLCADAPLMPRHAA